MSWTQKSIQALADQQANWVVETEGQCLSISNDEGIDAFLYVGEQQIIVEAPLFAKSSVRNASELNELILRTHQLLPLTTIGVKTIDHEDYYIAFGALSASSHSDVIVEEVNTLFANIGEFLELYAEHLTLETAI